MFRLPETVPISSRIWAKQKMLYLAKIYVLQLLDHRPIISSGYTAVLHIHTLAEEITIDTLLQLCDSRGVPLKKKARFIKSNSCFTAKIRIKRTIALEKYEVMGQLGRFTLRDEGRTIAIGEVLKLPK